MNLYNNGFSGGFVAALLLPILERVFMNRRNSSVNTLENAN
jgi:hypothetical protein